MVFDWVGLGDTDIQGISGGSDIQGISGCLSSSPSLGSSGYSVKPRSKIDTLDA